MSQKTPECIGIIMDGNRRWAKSKGLPTFAGHEKGYEVMKNTVEWAKDLGVKNIIFFAFSEENWKRTEEEVSYLMGLIRRMLAEETKDAIENKVRLKYIGDLSKFSDDIARGMKDAEEKTEHCDAITVAIAVSYGGRQEIVRAINKMIADGLPAKAGKKGITIEDMNAYVDTADMPDPDIIIRTSGEQRLSGFLTWQSVYSELFFTNTLWPDFSREEFGSIVDEYSNRERRLGK